MMKETTKQIEIYHNIWENNFKEVEELLQFTQENICDLEKQLLLTQEIYDNLNNTLDVLNSLYNQISYLPGTEEVLRLKEILKNPPVISEDQNKYFEVINYLLRKIKHLQNDFAQTFPFNPNYKKNLNYASSNFQILTKEKIKNENFYTTKKYKWISFQLSENYFILPYQHLKIIKNQDRREITVNNNNLKIEDLSFLPTRKTATKIIVLNYQHKNYAYFADKIEKKILADKNVFFPEKTNHRFPYNQAIRLFGQKHYWITPQ